MLPILGKNDLLSIFVIHPSLTSITLKAQEDIKNQVYDILLTEYSIVLSESIVIVKDNYVIAGGYANKIEFMTRKEAKQLC